MVEHVLVDAASPGVGVTPASEHEEPAASECSVLAPSELTCDGDEVPMGNLLFFSLAFGPASASNTDVHLIQVVNETPVFWYSCKVNMTLWMGMYLDDVDCRESGEAVFGEDAKVRLHLSHLPAAGRLTVGNWVGRIETVEPESVEG